MRRTYKEPSSQEPVCWNGQPCHRCRLPLTPLQSRAQFSSSLPQTSCTTNEKTDVGADRDRWVYASEFREPGIPTTVVISSKPEMGPHEFHDSASPVTGQRDFIPMSNVGPPAGDPPSYKEDTMSKTIAICAGTLILFIVLYDPILCLTSPQTFCEWFPTTLILLFPVHIFLGIGIALLIIDLVQRVRQSKGRPPPKLTDSWSKKVLWCILAAIIAKDWYMFWFIMGQIKLGYCDWSALRTSYYEPYYAGY